MVIVNGIRMPWGQDTKRRRRIGYHQQPVHRPPAGRVRLLVLRGSHHIVRWSRYSFSTCECSHVLHHGMEMMGRVDQRAAWQLSNRTTYDYDDDVDSWYDGKIVESGSTHCCLLLKSMYMHMYILFAFEIHIFTLNRRVHYSSGFLCRRKWKYDMQFRSIHIQCVALLQISCTCAIYVVYIQL